MRPKSRWPLLASQFTHAGPMRVEGNTRISPWSLRSRVEELGRAGFAGIGLSYHELAHTLAHEAEGGSASKKLAWLKRLLDDNGIPIIELECLMAWFYPPGHPRREAEQPMRELTVEAAGALKARHIKVAKIDTADMGVAAMHSAFAALCTEAAAVGTRVVMELLPPDPHSRTIDDALAWTSGFSNGGILLDLWHVNNIPGITYDDVRKVPREMLVGVEIDDGLFWDADDQRDLAEAGMGFIEQTGMRRVAGDGDYDVIGFIQAIAATGYDGPWGHEILSDEFRALPMKVAYRRAFQTAAALFDRAMSAT